MWDEMDELLNDQSIENEARFQALPDEIKTQASKEAVSKKIVSISSKYKLSNSQTGSLARIIKIYLIEDISLDELGDLVSQGLSVNVSVAQKIAKDLDMEILQTFTKVQPSTPPETEEPAENMPPSPAPSPQDYQIPEPKEPEAPVEPPTPQRSSLEDQSGLEPTPSRPMPTFPQREEPLAPDEPPQPRPRIDGNIVDLKNQLDDQRFSDQ